MDCVKDLINNVSRALCGEILEILEEEVQKKTTNMGEGMDKTKT